MSESFSSTFRYGALRGWRLSVRYRLTDGQLWRATVTLEASPRPRERPLIGGMAFAPLVEGYTMVHDLFVNGGGGHTRQRAVADLLIGNMREAVEHRADELGPHAPVWRELVGRYDEDHADYYARTGLDTDESPGFFEVVGRYVFTADRLAPA